MTRDQEHYLGDGLYAFYNGQEIRLRAPRADGDHVVYLEPAMFDDLVAYVATIEAQIDRARSSTRIAGVTGTADPDV